VNTMKLRLLWRARLFIKAALAGMSLHETDDC